MNLSDIDAQFVQTRANALEDENSERNTRFDTFERFYRLDVWQGKKPEGQQRVTSPRPWNVVEATRALLFTRRPVIEVPSSKVLDVADEQASRIEKYLYGAWEKMGLLHVIDDCEFWATGQGLGVIRAVYDPTMPVGEFPLVCQAIDPRTFYNHPDPRRPLQSTEVVITSDRKRRDIEAEWGPLPTLREGEELEEWLDEEVEYFDYWCTMLVDEPEEEDDAEPEEEPEGAVGKFLKTIGEVLVGPDEEETPEEEDREGDENREKVKRRRVVNCVVADGEFVKEPVVMPGYEHLPFYYWAGVRTPLEGKDRYLSVLYGVAGGERGNDSQGLIATENELLSERLRTVKRRANAALISNDPALQQLNSSPNAVNPTSLPSNELTLEWVVPPGDSPDLVQLAQDIGDMSQQATVPNSMMGQYQAGVSGVALQLITNPVLMRTAAKQREREEVLQRLNQHLLALTEEYAPSKGWYVWGTGRLGVEFEERLEPDVIKGYRRNRVKLSARLPRDVPQEALMLSQLTREKLMSLFTARDKLLEMLDMAGVSPEDEEKRLLIEDALFHNEEVRTIMGREAVATYSQAMARLIGMAEPPPPPPGPPGGLGQGPMQGMPPGVLPPQGVPAAVGGPNPQGMLNMQGQGLTPPGGRPPVPGQGAPGPGGPP
jgi:hypothetical protein